MRIKLKKNVNRRTCHHSVKVKKERKRINTDECALSTGDSQEPVIVFIYLININKIPVTSYYNYQLSEEWSLINKCRI